MLHPPRCGRFRPSIDYRSRAKAGDLFRIGQQPTAQPATGESHVYHMITPEYPAHFCRSQHGRKGQSAPERANFVPPALRSVQRRHQEANLSGADRFGNLLETGNGETGATGEPDCIAAALRKQGFDAICKPWGQDDRAAGGARKKPLRHRPF